VLRMRPQERRRDYAWLWTLAFLGVHSVLRQWPRGVPRAPMVWHEMLNAYCHKVKPKNVAKNYRTYMHFHVL